MGPGYPATPHCLNYYRQNLRDLPVKGDFMPSYLGADCRVFKSSKTHSLLSLVRASVTSLLAQESYLQDNLNRGQLEIAGGSFSTPFIARDQAYSFTYESPVTGEDQQGQSPTLTSSFSSFLVNDNTPCSASEGFSFSNHDESGAIELSSMLSFTFFSPRIAVEKGDFLFDAKVTDSKLDAIHGAYRRACAIRTLTGHLGRISLEESTSSDNGRHGKFWGCEELNSDDRLVA
ncbi:hypothetical protein D5086_000993 [Populus alba]|uniref:Uncharacterized protein n=1 Tax=Populus alba TaxID=43335 RepID=A0ACC4CXW9_POPAL